MIQTEFTPLNITSKAELKDIIRNQFPYINTDSWMKKVSALYAEIKNGECILGIENEKLHRRVDVVSIKCFYTDENFQRFQLIEEKQVFTNGKDRPPRGYKWVAEKMQRGESPEHAAIRGLKEELKIFGSDVHVESLPKENTFEKRESDTYKGLECSYNKYWFSINIIKAHYKDSYVEVQGDKQTFFKWIQV